ncbi:MAG TPA: hypothetical protein VL549_06820 [Gemmatimonadales bacterium]|jgi:hypothetical protein|nr:hypothetical protein [Gemmatimonadales bacterium]
MRALLVAGGVAAVVAACGPANPCKGYQFDRLRRFSLPYAGRWTVARGDTLTFPDAPAMSDHFRLAEITLDTVPVAVGRDCVLRGQIVFRAPRADTIVATWFGQPEHAIVTGWPADLGPFAGLSLTASGGNADSMSGAILLDSKLGVQARPGMTARFVVGRWRAQRLSSPQ